MPHQPLSWKAEKRGDTYCSPACGRGCKYAWYLTAKRKARKLATRLGPGWVPIVHENLGWFWLVRSRCGRLEVREGGQIGSQRYGYGKNPKTYYSASLGPNLYWCDSSVPEDAIAGAVELAKLHAERAAKLVEGL